MKPEDSARARDKVLFYLKTKGPQTAAQLARRLSVTPMAVRQHLYVLEQEGFVDFHDERRKVGRPSRIWRLTSRAGTMFPDSHSELAVGIIDAVRSAFGEKGLARLVSERSRAQLQRYRTAVGEGELERRVAALCLLRKAEGYMAEWSQDADGTLWLIENNCPICAAASTCESLCEGELDVFRQLLGEGVEIERTEHIVQGARRCAYRIAQVQRTPA